MTIDVYLKGGQVIRLKRVSTFEVGHAADGQCNSWEVNLKAGWSHKPTFIEPAQIAAVVRVERWWGE